MTKRQGFTLAEVLITLGIIGVVAAMTIPTLMNQTGQAEFKTGFKKIVSTLSQAVTMSVALNSTDFSNLAVGTTPETTVYGMFNSRMNVIKTGDGSALTGAAATGAASNYTLFFNDGMAISFATSCATNNSYANACRALVDVNGTKKPNKLTNCATASAATVDNAGASACTDASTVIGDQFSVRFFNQQVQPNGDGARYVMYK